VAFFLNVGVFTATFAVKAYKKEMFRRIGGTGRGRNNTIATELKLLGIGIGIVLCGIDSKRHIGIAN